MRRLMSTTRSTSDPAAAGRRSRPFVRSVSTLVVAALVCSSLSGCAAIFRGNHQRVTVVTTPPGGTVMYQGQTIDDGESVIVRKRFDAPQFMVGEEGELMPVKMTYDPDLWLIGDAAFLLLGIIPGLIAGGIDFATGAWRNLDERQIVMIPNSD